ncbi:MAG: hypothetical protein M1562_00255 [Candidatus Marsarchaeota archaeon]|nr:hypothetical protein [Candidatus Marsarchaeota archaeon]
MTMVLGVRGREGVFLSSDKQATYGDTKLYSNKIFRLGSAGIIGVAGASWICNEMISMLRQNFSKEFNTGLSYARRHDMMDKLSSEVSNNRRRLKTLNSREMEENLTSFGVIMGFIDKDKRRADLIYSNSSGISEGVNIKDMLFNGSMDEIAIGFANQILRGSKISKMSSEEIKFVMYKIIRDIEEISTSVGLGVDIWSLSNDGRVKNYGRSELKRFENLYNRLRSDEAKTYKRLYSMLRVEDKEMVEDRNRRRSEAKR